MIMCFWGFMGRVRSTSYWTAAATHRGQEERAASHLERQQFEIYLPRMAALTNSGRERRPLMFPGWIFIKIIGTWSSICHTRGIMRLMKSDEGPVRVPKYELDRLLELTRSDGLVHLAPRLWVGDVVKIGTSGGAYAGLTGIVSEMSSTQRVQVLMQMLGRSVKRSFDERVLEVA